MAKILHSCGEMHLQAVNKTYPSMKCPILGIDVGRDQHSIFALLSIWILTLYNSSIYWSVNL